MKRFLAFVLTLTLISCAAIPASALDYYTGRDEIFDIYMLEQWTNYQIETAELIEAQPALEPYVLKDYDSFVSHYSKNGVVQEYYGTFGEQEASLWCVARFLVSGFHTEYLRVGDYFVDLCRDDADEENGLYVYSNGELTGFEKAYADGVVTEADVKALYEDGQSVEVIRRLGDVYHDQKLDISDIIVTRKLIMGQRTSEGDIQRLVADFDGSGVVDVGDIIALKNYIMSE